MCLTEFGITGLLVNPLFSIGIRKGNGYTQMGQPLWILVELIDVAWAWATSFWIKNISTLLKSSVTINFSKTFCKQWSKPKDRQYQKHEKCQSVDPRYCKGHG